MSLKTLISPNPIINSLSSSFLIFIQHLTWDHLALKNYFHLTSETHYFPGFIPRQLSISLWFYFSGFSVLGGSRSVSSSKNALYMHFLFPSRAWLLNHLYCDGSQNDISSPKCSHEFRIGNLITSLTSPFGCPIGISNQSNKNKFFFFFPSCLLRYGFQIQKCYPYPPSVCACSVCSSLWPHGLQPTRLLCPWNSPGEKTGVGCHLLFQGIFLTQGLNLNLLCLLHYRQILHCWASREAPFSLQFRPTSFSDSLNLIHQQVLSALSLECVMSPTN